MALQVETIAGDPKYANDPIVDMARERLEEICDRNNVLEPSYSDCFSSSSRTSSVVPSTRPKPSPNIPQGVPDSPQLLSSPRLLYHFPFTGGEINPRASAAPAHASPSPDPNLHRAEEQLQTEYRNRRALELYSQYLTNSLFGAWQGKRIKDQVRGAEHIALEANRRGLRLMEANSERITGSTDPRDSFKTVLSDHVGAAETRFIDFITSEDRRADYRRLLNPQQPATIPYAAQNFALQGPRANYLAYPQPPPAMDIVPPAPPPRFVRVTPSGRRIEIAKDP